jgi:hypothetical protein
MVGTEVKIESGAERVGIDEERGESLAARASAVANVEQPQPPDPPTTAMVVARRTPSRQAPNRSITSASPAGNQTTSSAPTATA